MLFQGSTTVKLFCHWLVLAEPQSSCLAPVRIQTRCAWSCWPVCKRARSSRCGSDWNCSHQSSHQPEVRQVTTIYVLNNRIYFCIWLFRKVYVTVIMKESYQVIFESALTFYISMATNCIQREIIREFTLWDHKTDLRDDQNDITFTYTNKWLDIAMQHLRNYSFRYSARLHHILLVSLFTVREFLWIY